MAKIAVIMADMFEDSEYLEPVAAFQRAGHKTVLIGLKPGAVITGKRGKSTATIEEAVAGVAISDFDALLIPGGYSPGKLRADEQAVDFVRNFVMSGKPVFSICHGPQLLVTADVLKGRTVTGWRSIIQDIRNAGAVFVDREVVEDGNLVSSRSPADLPAFIEACLGRLKTGGI